jgi:hypothetical protein
MKLPIPSEFMPGYASQRILRDMRHPATRVAFALYLLSGTYLIIHVVFGDVINPITLGVLGLWLLL